MNSSRTGVAVAIAAVLLLSACSASGGGSSHTQGSGGSPAQAATASFSGDEKGTITVNFCTGPEAELFYHFDGDTTKYPGHASATAAGATDPSQAPFTTIASRNSTLPAVSSDGTTFTLDGVHLYDLINHREIVLAGKVTCS